jgi:hypothetical protein
MTNQPKPLSREEREHVRDSHTPLKYGDSRCLICKLLDASAALDRAEAERDGFRWDRDVFAGEIVSLQARAEEREGKWRRLLEVSDTNEPSEGCECATCREDRAALAEARELRRALGLDEVEKA